MNPNVPDPVIAFGYGRRVCPGRYFAEYALFLTFSNVLACFDISPLDMQGKPADRVSERLVGSAFLFPAPYKVALTPRSDKVVTLIKEAAMMEV